MSPLLFCVSSAPPIAGNTIRRIARINFIRSCWRRKTGVNWPVSATRAKYPGWRHRFKCSHRRMPCVGHDLPRELEGCSPRLLAVVKSANRRHLRVFVKPSIHTPCLRFPQRSPAAVRSDLVPDLIHAWLVISHTGCRRKACDPSSNGT